MRLPVELTDFRRGGALLLPVVMMLGLLAWDWALHRPARERMDRLAGEAERMGISIRAALHPSLMPPAVRALLEANAIEDARLAELKRSGALAADLLRAATDLSSRSGLRVVATEPGLAVSATGETVIRAHLKATGTYAEFVRFLDALAAGDRLIAIDQFTLAPMGASELSINLHVSRLVVQAPPKSGGTR